MALTLGQKEIHVEIRSHTPRESARQTGKREESQCKATNRYSDTDRCRRAKARHQTRHQLGDANPQVFPDRPARGDRRANCPEASVLHDGSKTCALETFPGRVGGLRIGVRADLHAVILVGMRRKNERRKVFLLQTRREFQRIRFFCQRRHLQSITTPWNEWRVLRFFLTPGGVLRRGGPPKPGRGFFFLRGWGGPGGLAGLCSSRHLSLSASASSGAGLRKPAWPELSRRPRVSVKLRTLLQRE